MNKNPMINFFVGLLCGCSGSYAVVYWSEIMAIVLGAVSILSLIFAIYYNKEVLR